MKIKNIKQPEGGLLQSEQWASILQLEKKKILHLFGAKESELFGVVNKIPFIAEYLYIPRANEIDEDLLKILLEKAKHHSFGWIRIDIGDEKILKLFEKNNLEYVKAPHDTQPRENFIIDIKKSEKELLSEMKSKTRYNVNLAKKKNVKIFTSTGKKYIDKFCELVEATGNRKHVSFHNKDHYKKIIREMPVETTKLYVAEYEGEVVAANIISFYNGVATYLHGATSDEHRNVMAPFLLQWTAIKDAKENGCVWYDFGGVFSKSDDSGKMGITRFKKGFSPKTEVFETLGSYDIILSSFKYNTYKALQKLRKL